MDKKTANREKFTKDLAARSISGQRQGMFSSALPLTVGDASTDYQKARRPAAEIGKVRNFSNTRGKLSTTETFGKLQSNAVGDEYVDPGKYFLRKGARSIPANKSFKPAGGHKLVRHSEFEHKKEFDDPKPGRKEVPKNFLARSTSEFFQKSSHYIEDAYERKEDMRKLDYQRRAALILDKSKPYTTSVKQHGTFDPFSKTYAVKGVFPSKPEMQKKVPQYGPFRIGDLPR